MTSVNDPADGVGKTGRKLPDPKNLHRRTLHPEEHRRFFPEGFEIDIYPGIVVHLDHLPRTFGKIDFVPVEQMHPAQKRNEEQRCQKDDQQDSDSLIQLH